MSHSRQHVERLRLRHLRLLEQIEQHRSLRAVAGVLNLTQPAVSQMLKDLERAFGVTLVERSANGVSLSPTGQLALQRARSGLAAFDRLAAELEEGHSPEMRVGTNPAMMFQLLPKAIAGLKSKNAPMRFAISTGMVNDMLNELSAGKLDCYVGRIDWDRLPPSLIDILRLEPLTVTDLVLTCSASHPLAGRDDLSVRDLLDWPWALPTEELNNRAAFEAAFRNLGFVGPTPVVEIGSDPNALILLATQLDLLTCVPRIAFDAHPAAAAVCALELPDLHLPPIQIGFVTLEQNESLVALRMLREALKEAAAAIQNG